MAFIWPIVTSKSAPAEPTPTQFTPSANHSQTADDGSAHGGVLPNSYPANHGISYIHATAPCKCCQLILPNAFQGMLSSTRNIYNQTFAALGNILLQKTQEEQLSLVEKSSGTNDEMLLVQPRKRSRATFDNDHARTHPASWRLVVHEPLTDRPVSEAADSSNLMAAQGSLVDFSKSSIAALSLEQLEDLSAQILDRIQIKKRYNSTPLRRIIARQVSGTSSQTSARSVEDTFSQTDTLVNSEVLEESRESVGTIQARYNSTPLRRILARQASTEQGSIQSRSASASPPYEPASLEVRKARYNDTPLRRILSRQTSPELSNTPVNDATLLTPSPQRSASKPVRSNTPLRRILSRQVSSQIIPLRNKDDDELSDRADSVISPDSPTLSKPNIQSSAFIELSSEARIRAYETALWGLTKSTTTPTARKHFNSEARIRAYEEAIWAKSAKFDSSSSLNEKMGTIVTVTEVSAEAKKPKRIIVESKGSALSRILQSQTSRDWKAPTRAGVV